MSGDETDADDVLDPLRDRLESLESDLEAAETEGDLDEIDAGIESLREDLDSVELPEPEEEEAEEDGEEEEEEEEEEDPIENLSDDVDALESAVEDERGPYAADVVDAISDVEGTIADTRWAVEGVDELNETIDAYLEAVDGLVADTPSDPDAESTPDELAETLEAVSDTVEAADLDPDDDAETIADLLAATDDLESNVEDATAWSDLEVREQLRREGYYDVLDHVKDFPPEWHALKVHQKQGNVDMVLLALESLDSDFMEEHAMEALARMGSEAAIEPMVAKAKRRDTAAISVLGKIGVDDDAVVDTLSGYIDSDSNPALQLAAIKALGEVGAEEAVEPIAQQLVAENPDTRSVAARTLGLIGDTRAIEPLATVLETTGAGDGGSVGRSGDDEESVSDEGESESEGANEGDEDADSSLFQTGELDRVRASAAWALVQIGTAEALEIVESYADDAYLVQVEAEKVVAESVEAA